MNLLSGVCLGLLAARAGAQMDTLAATRHTITVAGRTLSYTARAGLLPIRNNDDGSIRAYVFFVAYLADRRPNEPARPITFAWNGGPGANALLLHLDAFGPRRLEAGNGGPPRVVDNDETLLTSTDLVFVDPVGTGFSRPTAPALASSFYGVREDIAATRELIRVYRTRFDAWDSPVYLMGESYGTWRASGTAAAMEDNGEHIAGVILISGGIPVGPLATPETRAALFLPQRIATAAYHHRLASELARDTARTMREAEDWGRNVYAPALTRRDALPADERRAIVARLGRYTGVDTTLVDKKTLVVDGSTFTHSMGAVNRFDTRQVATVESSTQERTNDVMRRTAIVHYLRDELGFKTDLAYLGLESGWSASGSAPNPNAEWKWDQGERGAALTVVDDGPPGGTPPWVQRTFAADRATRTFVAAGIYDSLNSCPLIAYQVSRLEPALRERVTLGCYVGGHMIYEDRPARASLTRDLRRFLEVRSSAPFGTQSIRPSDARVGDSSHSRSQILRSAFPLRLE